jgi:hypothetical protein
MSSPQQQSRRPYFTGGVDERRVPKWAADAHEVLQAGGGGALWEAVVDMWWANEKEATFEGPVKGAMAKMRPKQVGGWIS